MPSYLILIHNNDIRVASIRDIIDFLNDRVRESVHIHPHSKKGEVFITFQLTPEIKIQRKGGDNGLPSAEDLQVKMNFTSDMLKAIFRLL